MVWTRSETLKLFQLFGVEAYSHGSPQAHFYGRDRRPCSRRDFLSRQSIEVRERNCFSLKIREPGECDGDKIVCEMKSPN